MKIFFLINAARRFRGPDAAMLEAMRSLFRERGVECHMELSHSIDQCRAALEQAARKGYDSLWIGGGDGTVNNVLNATAGRFDSYAVVPLGTVNGLARALGTPVDPVEAVRWLLDGRPTGLELGRVGDRYFVLYATVGFHAAVFHSTSPRLKRLIGRAAFYAAGVREAFRATSLPEFEVELHTIGSVETDEASEEATEQESVISAPGRPCRSQIRVLRRTGYSLVISNFLNYSGFGAVREGEIGDSSFLVSHLFPSNRLWPMLRFFASVRYRRPKEDDPGVEHYRVTEAVVRSDRPLRLQVDGEPLHVGDDRELHFTCIPNAIQVLWNGGEPAAVERAECPEGVDGAD